MGLCISKDAKYESDSLRKYHTYNNENTNQKNPSKNTPAIDNEGAGDLSEKGAETVRKTFSFTDKHNESIYLLNDAETSQKVYCDDQVTGWKPNENRVPSVFDKSTPTKHTIATEYPGEASESDISHSVKERPQQASLENIETTRNMNEDKLKEGQKTKGDIARQETGFYICNRPGTVEKFLLETHSTDLVNDLSKQSNKNHQVEYDFKGTACTVKNGEQMTIEQKHVSIVKERVKEFEQKLLSTKGELINQEASRISRNSLRNIQEDKEERLRNPANTSSCNSEHRLDRLGSYLDTPRDDAQVKSRRSSINKAEPLLKTESSLNESEGKSRRVRRNRKSLVRASTVFSTETLSNLVDIYSREAEKIDAENRTIVKETETQETFFEDGLIAKLKRNDSSPGVDLADEVAVRRWKYKNRQRKLRESRIMWDNEEAVRGIRGSVLKAHTSMKIFM
ncbi:hypothetical protein GpartN1_g1251.t1 [Galdieria partita]|uniref:Uncharacterized protein n=1 Tax=Galdieria partita TaxID=83374 RepID=A0A9C7UNF5_9RHOD|nr:hypothetical protein GpartN1_g1251.t1 [Galdieria partita]